MTESITSVRLRQLAADLALPNAVATFWSEIEQVGSPLIERDPDEPCSCTVTFLWRETEPIENVVVMEGYEDDDPTMRKQQMTKLPDSDVWYRTLRMRSDIHGSYRLLPNDTFEPYAGPDQEKRFAKLMLDPLNPNRVMPARFPRIEQPVWEDGSIFALPDANPLPANQLPTDVPHGEVIETVITSAALGGDRRVWIHIPTNLKETTKEIPLLIQVDGAWCLGVLDIPWLIDGMVAEDQIPPVITAMVDTVDRGNDLPCNSAFADFLADELIPWLRESYSISNDPKDIIVAGQSYGGLAATWAGLKRPDAIGNVLCQSGSFWWWPEIGTSRGNKVLGTETNHAWLPGYVARAPKVDVRFWLEAGLMEDGPFLHRGPSLLTCHRHMRDVLIAKNYDVAYREFASGHDFHVWRGLYPDGLRYFLADLVPPRSTSGGIP